MAKKFVKVTGLNKVFEADSAGILTTSSLKSGLTTADSNSILFITATGDDAGNKVNIGTHTGNTTTVSQGDAFIWAKGVLFNANDYNSTWDGTVKTVSAQNGVKNTGSAAAVVIEHDAGATAGANKQAGGKTSNIDFNVPIINTDAYGHVSSLSQSQVTLGSAATKDDTYFEKAFDDGSATIASVSSDIVTLKGGVAQTKGAISNSGTDITLAKVAKTGAYSDLTGTPTIPTVNNGVLTIQAAGTSKGTFSANQSGDTTINITAADLGLESAMHFIGLSTTDPKGTSGATVPGHTRWQRGDVVTYGNKEYVLVGDENKAAYWSELGDESSHALKTITITGTGVLSGGGSLEQNRTITHNTSGVTSGTYGNATTNLIPVISVDSYGHITHAENKVLPTSSNQTVTAHKTYDGGVLTFPENAPVQFAVGSELLLEATDMSGDNIIYSHKTSGVTAANNVGSSTKVPVLSVNTYGHVTALSSTDIAFPVTSVAGKTGAVTLDSLTIKGENTAVATYNGNGAKSLNIVAGNNVTVTPDATNGKITIAAAGDGHTHTNKTQLDAITTTRLEQWDAGFSQRITSASGDTSVTASLSSNKLTIDYTGISTDDDWGTII